MIKHNECCRSSRRQASIGDIVKCRMSRGGYSLRLTTQAQVDVVNELLKNGEPGWSLKEDKE